jgi:parallel beta-helix repeat protein
VNVTVLNGSVVYEYDSAPDKLNYSVGDIITGKTGMGYLRKINNIEQTGSKVKVLTENASLEDVIKKGEIKFEKNLTSAMVQTESLASTSSLARTNTQFTLYEFDIDYEKEFTVGGVDISITGSASFDINLIFEARYDWLKGLQRVYFAAQTVTEFSLGITASKAIDYSKEITLFDHYFPTFMITVGGILPVFLTPRMSVLVGLDAALEGSLTTSIQGAITTESGVKYENGAWSPVNDVTRSIDYQTPTLKGSCEAEVYSIIPKLQLVIDGVVGPYFDLRPYLSFDAEASATVSQTTLNWNLDAGLKGTAGIEIAILGRTIADYSNEIFDLKWDIAQGDVVIATSTVPSAPLNLQATAGNGQVSLSWSVPSSDGGSAITGYKVYRGTSSGGETYLTTALGKSYINVGLTNGQKYYYKVSAVNLIGEGAKSSEVSAIPSSGVTVPAAPQSLEAIAGDCLINLSWQVPISDGGSPITNYLIYRGTSAGGEVLLVEIGNALSYSDVGLTNNITYYYKVSARNVIGIGAYSNEANATPRFFALIAEWNFDENSGTALHDNSGNNWNGTIVGATWTSGISGSALSFDGTDYVTIPGSSSLSLGSGFSIEIWFNTSSDGKMRILSKGSEDWSVGWEICINVNQKANFNVVDTVHEPKTAAIETTQTVNDGMWHQLVVVGVFSDYAKIYLDGEFDNAIVYLDGSPPSDGSWEITSSIANNLDLVMGYSPTYDKEYFNGVLDEINIFSRALNASEINARFNNLIGSQYISHAPISIIGDAGFLGSNASTGITRGNGTESDPYIIEGWEIDASASDGICVQNTNAYFVVRDCYVHNGGSSHIGIFLYNCVNGILINDNCSNNWYGIVLESSSSNTLSNNTCSNNSYDGIYLLGLSHNNTIIGNICWWNNGWGIKLNSSSNNTLANNYCSYNMLDGIRLDSSNGSMILDNNCSNSIGSDGISINFSEENMIFNNNCSNNDHGINLYSSNNSMISNNTISNNVQYGVILYSGCSSNSIWNNTFIGNNGTGSIYDSSYVQATDSGTNNRWNSSSGYGNYWGDWTTPDGNSDGIVDNPYVIGGSAASRDEYPLTTPP